VADGFSKLERRRAYTTEEARKVASFALGGPPTFMEITFARAYQTHVTQSYKGSEAHIAVSGTQATNHMTGGLARLDRVITIPFL